LANPIIEGFSISHAAVLDGATSATDIAPTVGNDVYGVRSGALAPDTGQFDNEGDDAVLSSWYWLNFATIDVTSGYISFTLIAAMTGRQITSSGAGATQRFVIDLWHEDDMNVAAKPMLLRVPSKDNLGNPRRLDVVLNKVQFGPLTFSGPSYKAGMETTYSGRALASYQDELGAAYGDGKKRIGRLISGPII
jgi:hypothetical protein